MGSHSTEESPRPAAKDPGEGWAYEPPSMVSLGAVEGLTQGQAGPADDLTSFGSQP